MASVGQTNDTLTNVQVVAFLLFLKPKVRLEDCKALIKVWSTPWSSEPEHDNKKLLHVFQDVSALVQNI